jgi:hypothetical protein
VIGGALGGDGEVAKDVWNELLLVVALLTRTIGSHIGGGLKKPACDWWRHEEASL